jgi:hypothetical protein
MQSPTPLPRTLPPKPRGKWLSIVHVPTLSKKTRYIVFGALVLFVIWAGYNIYERFWTHSPFGPTQPATAEASTITATTTPSGVTEAEIIAAVGKLMLLPSDETPTLAKVSDPAVLQDQIFFKNAVIGDVVLMYAKSLRAILYDPQQNKIIEVGPIAAATSSPSTPQ